MTVEPGFGGQKLIPECLKKITELKKIRGERGLSYEIEVDGGVGLGNLREVMESGSDVIVAGSAVFGADDIGKTVREMLDIIREYD